MSNVCINYVTFVSNANDEILREVKHIPDLRVIKDGDKALRVRYTSQLRPDIDFLAALHKRYNMWWIKNEWLTENGKAGVWIANGNDIKNYEWDDLSLEDEHYYF